MQVKPVIGSVVGKTDEVHWGQVLIAPSAYGVVEIEDPAGLARQHGVGSLIKLSGMLEKPPTSLSQVQKVAEAVMGDGIVSLILLVPVGTVVYLVMRGQGAIYLKRGQQLACLLKQSGELSGEVNAGDTLLLVSKSFAQALNGEQLTSVFDHLSATEAAEKLTLLLHEAEDGRGGAGFIFQVHELIPLEEETIISKTAVAQPVYEKVAEAERSGISLVAVKEAFSRRHLVRLYHALKRFLPVLRGRNKLVILVSAVLIVFFIVSVIIGIRREFGLSQSTQTTKALTAAQHAYDEGVALLDLNPIKGRERLVQAKQLLSPLLPTASSKSKTGRQIKALYEQVTDSLGLAMQVNRGEPQLFYDGSLLKKDASIFSLALEADTLVALDKTTKTVFSLDILSKSGQILAGGDAFQTASLIGLHGDNAYVLTSQGIHAVGLSDKTVTSSVIKPDSGWGTITALVAYGGNIYLLDTTKSRIWKYVAIGKGPPAGSLGFSDLREYLNPDTLPNLQTALNMAIDGSVWLGTAEGKILRFTQGKEATFLSQGVDPGWGMNLLVYTDDDNNNVYVLDRGQKRVVVLDKNGVYVAQYVWEGNFNPTQIVASEKQKKIFLLIEGKIYALNLK